MIYAEGDKLETTEGNCCVLRVHWKKHHGQQVDVRFDDGEECCYADWQLDLMIK